MKEKADQKTSGLRVTWADGYGGALGAEGMGSGVGGGWVTWKTPTPIERAVSRGKKTRNQTVISPNNKRQEAYRKGSYDRQNNALPKDVHVLVPGTCEYVMLHSKGN